MPLSENFPGPHGDIIRPVRGCEACGSQSVAPDLDGIWCCADCGLTTLRNERVET